MKDFSLRKKRFEHYLKRKDLGTLARIIAAGEADYYSLSVCQIFRDLYGLPVRDRKEIDSLIIRAQKTIKEISPEAKALIKIKVHRFSIYYRAKFLGMVINKEITISREKGVA